MGDPKRLRKKYSKPSHPWQKLRIDEEKVLMKDYGFKNKTELWKLNSLLRKWKLQIKELIPRHDEFSEIQKRKLIQKLYNLKLVKENAIPEDILALSLKDVCERRLQTLVFRKQLARTIKQARQFIVHEHIMIGDKKITSPSYIVSAEEEEKIRFADNSKLAKEDHPERIPIKREIEAEMKNVNLEPHKKPDMEEDKKKHKEEKAKKPKKEKIEKKDKKPKKKVEAE